MKRTAIILTVFFIAAGIMLSGCGMIAEKVAEKMGMKVVTVYYPDGVPVGKMTIRPIAEISRTIDGVEIVNYKCSVVFMCVNERPMTVKGFDIYDSRGIKMGGFWVEPFEMKARVIKRMEVTIPSNYLDDPYRAVVL